MKTLSLLAAISLFVQSASATEWHVLGARAVGMGGAGVAIAQGAVGSYWNPAGLGQAENPSGVQVPVGAGVNITGTVLEGANDLNEVVKACNAGNATICTTPNVQSALNKLNNPDNGVRADVGAAGMLKIKKLTLFVNNLAYVGGKPFAEVNFNNTSGNVASNRSKISLRGIVVHEIGVGYGRQVPFIPGLLVGANLKGLVGRVGYKDILLASEDPGEGGSLGDFKDNSKTTIQPGLDVGVLWDVNKTFEAVPFRPRLGLSARNINSPKFKQPAQATLAGERDHFTLQSNLRAGAAISPFRWWNIAADADLSRNLTPLDGVTSQMAGLGTEINVFNRTWLNIPLRFGAQKNMAQKGAKTSLTAGFGLNFLHLNVDVGAAVSPSDQTVQSQGKSEKVPSSASVGIQLGLMFGGGKEEKPRPE